MANNGCTAPHNEGRFFEHYMYITFRLMLEEQISEMEERECAFFLNGHCGDCDYCARKVFKRCVEIVMEHSPIPIPILIILADEMARQARE